MREIYQEIDYECDQTLNYKSNLLMMIKTVRPEFLIFPKQK